MLHVIPDHELVGRTDPTLMTDANHFTKVVTGHAGPAALHGKPEGTVSTRVDFVPTHHSHATVHSTWLNSTALMNISALSASAAPLSPPSSPAAPLAAPPSPPEKWARLAMEPTVGTLLLAAGSAFSDPREAILKDAAVLLIHKCGCDSLLGVVVNKPTIETMRDAFCPKIRNDFPRYLNNTVFLGGPVGPAWITMHTRPVLGSVEAFPGVYLGGYLPAAHYDIEAGAASAWSTYFFYGYAAWPVERLREEVAAGKWIPISVPLQDVHRVLTDPPYEPPAAYVQRILAAADSSADNTSSFPNHTLPTAIEGI